MLQSACIRLPRILGEAGSLLNPTLCSLIQSWREATLLYSIPASFQFAPPLTFCFARHRLTSCASRFVDETTRKTKTDPECSLLSSSVDHCLPLFCVPRVFFRLRPLSQPPSLAHSRSCSEEYFSALALPPRRPA